MTSFKITIGDIERKEGERTNYFVLQSQFFSGIYDFEAKTTLFFVKTTTTTQQQQQISFMAIYSEEEKASANSPHDRNPYLKNCTFPFSREKNIGSFVMNVMKAPRWESREFETLVGIVKRGREKLPALVNKKIVGALPTE